MPAFDPIAFMRRTWKDAPWLTIAVALHAVVLAGMVIWVIGEEPVVEDVPPVEVNLRKPQPTPDETPPPPAEVTRYEIPDNIIAEVVEKERDLFHEALFVEHDWSKEVGDPEGSEDYDLAKSSTSVGAGNRPGQHGTGPTGKFRPHGSGTDPFGPRGVLQGNTQGTEKAVLEGLRWLLRHGNEDGSWSAKTCAGHCLASGPCLPGEDGSEYTEVYDTGLTGLALLCFLGAGYSNESLQTIGDPVSVRGFRLGPRIKDGLMWLKDRQNADGSFSGGEKAFLYNEALAAMAMIENYGLSKSRYWKESAQRAVDFLCASQRPSPNGLGLWGWRYASRMDVEKSGAGTGGAPQFEKELYDSDVSVTTWCVMALKSAQLCGLDVPEENMQGALDFVKWCTDPRGSGLVGYLSPEVAGMAVEGIGSDRYTYHVATMSALGMLTRTFVAHDADDPVLEQSAKVLLKDLPVATGDHSSIDYYYWYYGSLALNQFDGEKSPRHTGKYWRPWEHATATTLLELQGTDEQACSRGGWLVKDRWVHYGGPIYATAMNVLTLEVYYRFANAFGTRGPDSEGADSR